MECAPCDDRTLTRKLLLSCRCFEYCVLETMLTRLGRVRVRVGKITDWESCFDGLRSNHRVEMVLCRRTALVFLVNAPETFIEVLGARQFVFPIGAVFFTLHVPLVHTGGEDRGTIYNTNQHECLHRRYGQYPLCSHTSWRRSPRACVELLSCRLSHTRSAIWSSTAAWYFRCREAQQVYGLRGDTPLGFHQCHRFPLQIAGTLPSCPVKVNGLFFWGVGMVVLGSVVLNVVCRQILFGLSGWGTRIAKWFSFSGYNRTDVRVRGCKKKCRTRRGLLQIWRRMWKEKEEEEDGR